MRSIKKKVKSVIIYMLSLVIFGMLVYITVLYITDPVAVKLWKPCIPDEEAAVRLAQIAVRSYYDIDIEKEAFVAVNGNYNFGNEWQVRLKNVSDFNKNYIVSDDSGVFINAQDGTIDRFMIPDSYITSYYELKELYELNEDILNEK